MPRQEPVARFKITFNVAPDRLGETLVKLTEIEQIEDLHHDLILDVPRFAKNIKHDTNADDFARAWLADHATFKAIELVKVFRDNGRTDGAAYSALRRLCEAKTIKKVGPGNYSRFDVAAIAAPKKAKKSTSRPPKTPGQPGPYNVSNAEMLLRLARRNHGRLTSEGAKRYFASIKRPPSSVSPVLRDLIDKKLLRRISDSTYQLTAKATPKKKPNGSAEHVVTPAIEQAAVTE